MDIYVGRQPIFDRNMNVFAYELLYRRSMNNFFEGTDDNKATAELINNYFFSMHSHELTSGTKAFINFSQDMLMMEIPLLLPVETTVVEVLERVEINEDIIAACAKLRDSGYIIALDDFVFNESYLPLMEIAHIIKIEFSVVDHEAQRELIKKYKNKIKFLAEKVETREEYLLALDMGYDYFQGYFFSKPVIVKGKEIGSLNDSLIRIMNELNRKDPDYQRISQIIETDMGLSYKLLKLANSAFFGTRNQILSIKQALVQLGLIEIKKWVFLMMLKDIQSIENKELIRNCFIRAKFMELLAFETGRADRQSEYFMTGMFSSIDILLNRDMQDIVKELCLADDVKEALLGADNEIKRMLDIVINYELLKFSAIDDDKDYFITRENLSFVYINALKWVMRLDY